GPTPRPRTHLQDRARLHDLMTTLLGVLVSAADRRKSRSDALRVRRGRLRGPWPCVPLELLAERDPTYERAGARFVRTRQHTIDAVAGVVGAPDVLIPFGWVAPAGVTSPLDVFAGYLLLDAWIGNADRHHENWAL